MGNKRNILILLIVLNMISGCSMKAPEFVVSMAIHCPDSNVDSIRALCFISDMAGHRLDTKSFIIAKDKNNFWTRYTFNVPKYRQVMLDVSAVNSQNNIYQARVNKITTERGDRQNVNLFLEEKKVFMSQYNGATIKVSGTIFCPNYNGLIKITVITEESQKKLKPAGVPVTQKIVSSTGDTMQFNLDIPVSLGPVVICFFRLGETEQPYCNNTNIGNSDIQGIDFTR